LASHFNIFFLSFLFLCFFSLASPCCRFLFLPYYFLSLPIILIIFPLFSFLITPLFNLDFLVILPHHVYVLLTNIPLAVQCCLLNFCFPSSVPFPSLFHFIIFFIFSILHPSYPPLCSLLSNPHISRIPLPPPHIPPPPLLSPITNDHLHAC
jgi:hypothetical protein